MGTYSASAGMDCRILILATIASISETLRTTTALKPWFSSFKASQTSWALAICITVNSSLFQSFDAWSESLLMPLSARIIDTGPNSSTTSAGACSFLAPAMPLS